MDQIPAPQFSCVSLGKSLNLFEPHFPHLKNRDNVLCAHSVVPNSVTPWTVTHQVLLFMGLPRQEYCSGLPLPPPGDLPNSGIKPESPALQAVSCIASRVFTSEPPGKPKNYLTYFQRQLRPCDTGETVRSPTVYLAFSYQMFSGEA